MYASTGIEQPTGMPRGWLPRRRGDREGNWVSQSAVSRLDAPVSAPSESSPGPVLALKTRGGGGQSTPSMPRRGTGELKNATLAPLTYIGVDAHDGVHIFRVIARLGAMNRSAAVSASLGCGNAEAADRSHVSNFLISPAPDMPVEVQRIQLEFNWTECLMRVFENISRGQIKISPHSTYLKSRCMWTGPV